MAVNERFEQLFRVSEANALGHFIQELWIRIEPAGETFDAPPQGRRGMPREDTRRGITPSERRIDLSVSSNVVGVRGEHHLLTITRDVTALRAAEAERERLTLEPQISEEHRRRVVRNVPVVRGRSTRMAC